MRAAAVGDATAWGSNPATIADSSTFGVFLSNRNVPWIEQGIGYSEAGVWWSNRSYGAVTINYSHLNLGELQQVFQNGQLGAIVRNYDDLLSATFASPSIEGFRVGATVKQFTTNIIAVSSNDSGFASLPVHGSGIWFDLGVTYQLPLTLNDDAEGPLTFGVALRDIGGDINYNEPSLSAPVATWLNIAGALTIPFPEFKGKIGIGIGALFQLTSLANQPVPINDERQNQLDAGLEIQTYGLSLRLGFHHQTIDNAYAQESTLSPRYGFGVNLPIRQIGINAPLILDFDYAFLPLNPRLTFTQGENVHALQLRLTYALL